MKRFIKAYTTFTRTERMGLLALFIIIGALLTIRLTMSIWAKPPTYTAADKELAAAWNTFKNNNNSQQHAIPPLKGAEADVYSHGTTNNNNSQQIPTQDINNQYYTTAAVAAKNNNKSQQKTTNPFPMGGVGGGFLFDPNTIDSAGLRKLGLREKTTSIFLKWRRKGKHFYSKEDLKGLYTLTPGEYERLEPYISISNTLHAKRYNYEDYGPMPAVVNINKADSVTLIRLKGIGPATAHRILVKRATSGRFSNAEQLFAACHFSDTIKQYLRQKLSFE